MQKMILLEQGLYNRIEAVVDDEGGVRIYTVSDCIRILDSTYMPREAKKLVKALSPLIDGPLTMHGRCLTRSLGTIVDGWKHQISFWNDGMVTTQLVGPNENDYASNTGVFTPERAINLARGLMACLPTEAVA